VLRLRGLDGGRRGGAGTGSGDGGREVNAPEVRRGEDELDADGPFAVLGHAHVNDADLLLFTCGGVDQENGLAFFEAGGKGDQTAVSVDRKRPSGFAEAFAADGAAVDFDGHGQAETLAAAGLASRFGRRGWGIHGFETTGSERPGQWYSRARGVGGWF
jgi:hypothetical protein